MQNWHLFMRNMSRVKCIALGGAQDSINNYCAQRVTLEVTDRLYDVIDVVASSSTNQIICPERLCFNGLTSITKPTSILIGKCHGR